jgi:hypothetical protein
VVAGVMAAGYALDLAHIPIFPIALFVFAGACTVTARVLLQPRLDGAFALVVVASFTYAMWIASPAFLPVTNGPDVVHHLQLVRVIETTRHLPHDTALYPYLLEMMGYTPGAHILSAAAASLLRADPLQLVYPIAAAFVAIKAGTIYALARRIIGPPAGGIAALAAPILAFGSSVYFLGCFVQFFFFAQVVSEAFAIGMLLALVRWLQLGEDRDRVALAACAVGVVLAWPVWMAPAGLTVVAAALFAPAPRRRRWAVIAGTLAPAAVFAAVHQLTHRGAAGILTSSGAVTSPSVAAFGAGFVVLAAAGTGFAVRDRAARAVVIFLAATLLVAGVLAWLAVRAGSTSYYMAFKMMYLVVPPAAVLGAYGLALLAAAIPARRARFALAWVPVMAAIAIVGGHLPLRRPHGSLSLPARDVARWALDRVPPACIDYFSSYWLTGYWLHLDVLGNPRLSDRMRQETFDFPDVAAKWIEGRGLPYAIVEDMRAIPREIRSEMEPLHQTGSFVLVRNRRPAACSY